MSAREQQIASRDALRASQRESMDRALAAYKHDPSSVTPTNVLLLQFWGLIPGREAQDARFRDVEPQLLRDAGRLPKEAS